MPENLKLRVVSSPGVEPVTLAEAKLQVAEYCDDSDTNAMITAMITAAREYCEGWQQRAYITQTIELYLDEWPQIIYLPRPNLQSVESITYVTEDGDTETFTDYEHDTKSLPGRIVPSDQWPTDTLGKLSPITVQYKAGYGDAASDVPAKIKQAILLLVAAYYEQREAFVLGNTAIEIPFGVHALLQMDSFRW